MILEDYPISNTGTALQIDENIYCSTADPWYEICFYDCPPVLLNIDEKKKNELYLNSLPGKYSINIVILPTMKPFNTIEKNSHIRHQRHKKGL